MVKYPIHVPTSPYGGNDPRKLEKHRQYNTDAKEIEEYVNNEIEKNGPGHYLYSNIAIAIDMPVERIQEILSKVDGGHNHIIVSHGVNGEPADFVSTLER